ncbi:A24 family peptidase [Euzebya sp.]|uniref:prepilin peptidase n=1 Tax=Euzebya sp. TaxID=1971409 RepID=UPI003517FDB1
MAGLVALLAGVLGLAFGSFANVVIHRVPEGRSVARPPSACPRCGTEIRPRDNIPVVSWLLLRGRCRDCGAPISPRYPVVELVCGALFAGTAWWLASADPPDWWALPAMGLFVWMLLVVTVIDYETRRIPNALTYPLTPALAVLLVVAALANGEPGRIVDVLIGGAGAFAFLLVLALINPRGMGMGDVKYAAFLGLGLGYVGLGAVVIGIFGAFLIGSVISIGLIVTRLRGRKDMIPFGPFLSIGALLALLFGSQIADAYLSAVGLA